jgi:hypothetical protein
MRTIVVTSVIIAGCAVFSFSAPPVQDLTPASLALDYSGLWRGEDITKKEVPSHEIAQHINLHYAPVPYALLSLGLGVANYGTDTTTFEGRLMKFKGAFGVSPSFGLNLYTPYLINRLLRITAGGNGYYLYSKSGGESYTYSGAMLAPKGGVIFSISEFLDIELGGRGLVLFGQMEKKGDTGIAYFSNKNMARGYFSVVMHTPSEGVYAVLDFDASPEFSMDWTGGPVESAISFSIGFALNAGRKAAKSEKSQESLLPGYEDLKKREQELRDEIK